MSDYLWQYQENIDKLIQHIKQPVSANTICNLEPDFTDENSSWFIEHGRPDDIIECQMCIALSSKTTVDEPEYHWMTLNREDHFTDLAASFFDDNLYGIVSENIDGGIIAYAIGEEHAERIVEALNKSG